MFPPAVRKCFCARTLLLGQENAASSVRSSGAAFHWNRTPLLGGGFPPAGGGLLIRENRPTDRVAPELQLVCFTPKSRICLESGGRESCCRNELNGLFPVGFLLHTTLWGGGPLNTFGLLKHFSCHQQCVVMRCFACTCRAELP